MNKTNKAKDLLLPYKDQCVSCRNRRGDDRGWMADDPDCTNAYTESSTYNKCAYWERFPTPKEEKEAERRTAELWKQYEEKRQRSQITTKLI